MTAPDNPEPPPNPKILVEEALRGLAAARSKGPAFVTDAAVAVFNAAMTVGDVPLATRSLEEAHDAARHTGNKNQQCLTLTWLARLARMEMKIERAERFARRAVRLVAAATPEAARGAYTELGEAALLRALSSEADQAFKGALEVPGTTPAQQCVLLEKRAQAARQSERHDDAVAFLAEAERVARAAGNKNDERLARLSQATIRHLQEHWQEAQSYLDPLETDAVADNDQKTLVQLYNLRAICRWKLEGVASGLEDALAARRSALAAVDALGYAQAAMLIAQLYEAEGNRLRALEAILTGKATLGDLIGRDNATEIFAPYQEAMKTRWGAAEYDTVSDAYIRERKTKFVM